MEGKGSQGHVDLNSAGMGSLFTPEVAYWRQIATSLGKSKLLRALLIGKN